ncbi:hypothetical protein [uncultured Psychroserpens sp.]|uniref:hypothetical protein n=1 Tax=uncultured Psychroserpens sp. TaxID=255436 RepID=UPI0026070ED1|nr:hypothetical protein [uncultured Psychroserpens sp.]
MKSLKFFFFLIVPIFSSAQTVKGIIYDAETTIKGAKLINTTQNVLSYSDGKGLFSIRAKRNDTLIISSYFHYEKTYVIKQSDFEEDIVIELKKITNELDEVEITKVNEKEFDTTAFQSNLKVQTLDFQKPSLVYSGENLQPTLDVIGLVRAIGKLFKKKQVEIKKIEVEDLQRVFTESTLFTTPFLRNELHISEIYEFLFFEYCSAQHLDLYLLEKDNEFLLLDELLIHSKAFNKLVEDYEKD